MKREPSIRDIERRNDPKVTILPTAARRMVQQPSCVAVRAARAAAPWPGERKDPQTRDAERETAGTRRTPELLILLAILKVLTPEQRREVQDITHRGYWALQDGAALTASAIVAGLREGE